MPAINQLPTASSVNSSDLLPIYSSSNGDARKLSISALLTYFKSLFTAPDLETTVSTPANGFTYTCAQDSTNQWVLLRPTGALATGTIVLPLVDECVDGQEILVTNTLQITTLTIDINGATAIYGAPATLSAEDRFRIRFHYQTQSWYGIV